MQKISEAEMEIMNIVWKYDGGVTSKDIMEAIPEKQWKITTVLTLMSRLVDKGFLKAEKNGRGKIYNSIISEKEYKKMCSKNFLNEFYEGSAKNFFAALFEDNEISESNLEELKSILERDE
ncbi:BlaI/MecI/CopY family transcriptional regulator [Tyzzerella sp. An114]|uniref:BlaI/MecI/CopY family transcriptional regulator n=1 Tax=Tyzzerella sp. An114 TaxID=1965545 RepID=UPI00130278F1|nr:BlaI/MecI/CopY family transcriptional regulator [Tyzzerella sp. An114]